MIKRSIHFLIFTLALLSIAVDAFADEIPPGRILDPAGLQRSQGVAYNSALDEYLLIFPGNGIPKVRRLGTDGVLIAPATNLAEKIGIKTVGIVYNADDDQYLALFRSGDVIFGRYLDTFGQPLSSSFQIGTGAAFGTAAYSSTSNRYLVVWSQGPKPTKVKYAFIDGDSTSGKPIAKKGTLATGKSPSTVWGSVSNKFLVLYIRGVGGDKKEEVFGKIVEGDGSNFGNEKLIAGGKKAQTRAEVGYAPTNDTFLAVIQDWVKSETHAGDTKGQFVDSSGNRVGGKFNIVATVEPPPTDAVSLGRYIDGKGGAPEDRAAISEVTWRSPKGTSMKIAFRTEEAKFIATLSGPVGDDLGVSEVLEEELYDLLEDPTEQKNLILEGSAELGSFRSEIRSFLDTARALRTTRRGQGVELGEELLERLRSLGYVDH